MFQLANRDGRRAQRRLPRWVNRFRRYPLLLTAAGLAVAAIVLVPLYHLILRAFERGPAYVLEMAFSQRNAELLWRTGVLAVTVTAACLIIGVACAWLITRSDIPFRRTLGVLFTLPLAVPSLVAGSAWLSVWPGIAGFGGVFLVLTLGSYPFVMLPVMAALRSGDIATEEAARSLGKGPVCTFFLVTVRGVRPAAAAGSLLTMLYVLGDFAAPSLMRYETFTIGIFASYRGAFDRTPAAIFGCVLVLVAAIIMIMERRARGKAARFGQIRVGKGVSSRPPVVPLGRAKWPAFIGSLGLLGGAIGFPVGIVIQWFISGSSRGFDMDRIVETTGNTLWFSAGGALLAVVMAFPIAVLAARHDSTLSRSLESVSYLGHALPAITIGLAFVFVGIRVVPGWYQQTPLLVLAYAVLFLPLAVVAVRAGIAAAPASLEEVSRSLGKNGIITHLRVTIPLAIPGVAAGVALVFLSAAKELPATLMLRPTGANTLTTEMWTLTNRMMFAASAPYALLLLLVSAIPALVMGLAVIERKKKRRRLPVSETRL